MKVIVVLTTLATLALGLKIPFKNIRPKVAGGQDAQAGEFPYIVSVEWTAWGTVQHVCGGTILSDSWVVTAATCMTAFISGSYRINAGITNRNDVGQIRNISETILHPDFINHVNPSDIAMLKLSEPLEFNEFVQAAKLPSPFSNPIGNGVIAGWGSISLTNIEEFSDQLQTAVLPIITYEECEWAILSLTETTDPLIDFNVCTGPLDGGIGACSGDEGGPLLQNNTIVGIYNWGFNTNLIVNS